MSNPLPNDTLTELADVLGTDNVKTLIRTFLREFPVTISDLTTGDRKNQHRFAHSMKSNARLMGAHELSRHMAAIELRLMDEKGAPCTPEEIAAITAEFEAVAKPLRAFVDE